jgi:hypothetical protein
MVLDGFSSRPDTTYPKKRTTVSYQNPTLQTLTCPPRGKNKKMRRKQNEKRFFLKEKKKHSRRGIVFLLKCFLL